MMTPQFHTKAPTFGTTGAALSSANLVLSGLGQTRQKYRHFMYTRARKRQGIHCNSRHLECTSACVCAGLAMTWQHKCKTTLLPSVGTHGTSWRGSCTGGHNHQSCSTVACTPKCIAHLGLWAWRACAPRPCCWPGSACWCRPARGAPRRPMASRPPGTHTHTHTHTCIMPMMQARFV